MKIGEQSGCLFNDRIDLELSPSDLMEIISLVEERAMAEKDYSFQGLWRTLKDYLQSRHDAWEEARESKQEKSNGE